MPGADIKARFTVVTLGVADMATSIRFYGALGFTRKMQATGEAVAFFETGGSVLALFPWEELAEDAAANATKQENSTPRPQAFRGMTLAWNCHAKDEVDAVMAHALACGGQLRRAAEATDYGGYRGYFADPDGHLWEVVTAPGLTVQDDGRLVVPD